MVSPFFAFIKNPLLWIDLISRLKATSWSVAPNFAYGLAAHKFIEGKSSSQTPIPGLDLSSIAYLQNAAEPIQIDTRELFEAAFLDHGLNPNWFMSGYGLTKNVVS